MKATLVNNAITMAIWQRRPVKGLIWHTDRGSQYCSNSHREILKDHGVNQILCVSTKIYAPINLV